MYRYYGDVRRMLATPMVSVTMLAATYLAYGMSKVRRHTVLVGLDMYYVDFVKMFFFWEIWCNLPATMIQGFPTH